MNFCGLERLGCDASVEGGLRMGWGGMVEVRMGWGGIMEARMGSSEEGV